MKEGTNESCNNNKQREISPSYDYAEKNRDSDSSEGEVLAKFIPGAHVGAVELSPNGLSDIPLPAVSFVDGQLDQSNRVGKKYPNHSPKSDGGTRLADQRNQVQDARLERIEGRLDNLEDQVSQMGHRLQTDISAILQLLQKTTAAQGQSGAVVRPMNYNNDLGSSSTVPRNQATVPPMPQNNVTSIPTGYTSVENNSNQETHLNGISSETEPSPIHSTVIQNSLNNENNNNNVMSNGSFTNHDRLENELVKDDEENPPCPIYISSETEVPTSRSNRNCYSPTRSTISRQSKGTLDK